VTIRWSLQALRDVDRLVDFIAAHDTAKADEVEAALNEAPKKSLHFNRMGSRLSEFDPREVRELRFARYILRYELVGTEIRVLRIFHGRENRF
jgi:plasmid stabilization system protein ParE